eukprot:s818_g18.t1
MSELSYDGPSQFLPCGPQLVQLRVKRFSQKLVASITDRRDFYYQARVSLQRAQTNLLHFSFAKKDWIEFSALEVFEESCQKRKRGQREEVGDKLGWGPSAHSTCGDPHRLYPGFRSLFQGDHLGVEFALASQQTLLKEDCLLRAEEQIRGKHPFPKGPHFSGLVIDDFFYISREPKWAQPLQTAAARALTKARDVYKREGLLGSEEKDVEAQSLFKAVGAEVNSSDFAVSSGFVTVGGPVAKRLALSVLSLRASALPGLSPQLASRLAGNWTSLLMYRCCLCAVVDGLFAFGTHANDLDPCTVLPLPRKLCRELVLLSSLAPIMCSNVAVDYLARIFASDASLAKGAYVSADIGPEICEEVWLDSDKRGGYVTLDGGFKEILWHLGEKASEDLPGPGLVRPKASPLLYFDFVEICGGVGAVSSAANGLGLVVAPPLDLSASSFYDLQNLRLLDWILHMIQQGRFFSEAVLAACQFGSIHQKEFRFLVHLLAVEDVERRCTRDHPHVKIQGGYTKQSAIYTPEMGLHLAIAFKKALRRVASIADHDWTLDGLESVVTNDLMLTAKWGGEVAWFWRRLNVADDPTRDVPLRDGVSRSILEASGVDFRLLHRAGLKRSAANWIRLLLLVSSLSEVDAASKSQAWCLPWILDFTVDAWISCLSLIGQICFGLSCLILWTCLVSLLCGLLWRVPLVPRLFWIWSALSSPALSGSPMDFRLSARAMEPQSAAERKRATERAGMMLTGDRVALTATRNRRKKLLVAFQSWLWREKGVSADPEKLAAWLVSYGKELYSAGKAYGIFAETINSVAAARPQVRKQLTAAWDYAFSWISNEPFSHHPALPASILVAIMSVALLWGWRTEAAIFGLTWSGILRIGETLQATRSDLVLPRDSAPGVNYALLKIREPKTRGKHAKRQAARIE